MKPSLFVILYLTFSNALLKGGEDQGAIDALGQSLVRAIAANDPVSYSHCWISVRQLEEEFKRMGLEEEVDVEKFTAYFRTRNLAVFESFEKIQALLDERKVNRDTLRLVKCDAGKIEEREAPKGTFRRSTMLEIQIADGGGSSYTYTIDDGVLVNGIWYFSDKPINLESGDVILGFRDSLESEKDKSSKPEEVAPDSDELPENRYEVQRGDTMFKISRKLGVSIQALREANGLENDLLKIGQWLVIPE